MEEQHPVLTMLYSSSEMLHSISKPAAAAGEDCTLLWAAQRMSLRSIHSSADASSNSLMSHPSSPQSCTHNFFTVLHVSVSRDPLD